MRARLEALLSRKFIGLESVLLSATGSFWFFGLEGNLYRDIVIAALTVFVGSNVYQKVAKPEVKP